MSELDPEKVAHLQDLTTLFGLEIPAEALAAAGITPAEYATWRMDLADEEQRLRDLLALADNVEAANRDALPPRRTPEEVAELERREQRRRRYEELRGEAEWKE